jgi:asparagine synthase (glutamine-hydrolysing)
MSNSQVQEHTGKPVLPQTGSYWVGILASEAPDDVPGFDSLVVAGEGRSKKLYLRNKVNFARPLWAESSGCGVIFDGMLYNHRELQRQLGDSLACPSSNSAEIILATYQRWGEDFLHRLRGTFALIIWDSQREVLLGLRDPIGSFPLFYTEHRDDLMLSPSIDVLLAQPSTSTALHRAVLAEFFLYRNPRNEETFFEAISRIRSGHLLRLARGEFRTHRYWDPAPGDTVNWATPEELERFDELLDQAVTRCVSLGSVGILLSGGLDSVSVAAFAAERAAMEGVEKPLALSLVFPGRDINEEIVQRGVASQLGLPQVIKGFYEATGKNGLLANAVAMNSFLSAPVLNTWLPAYHGLVREGKERGCRTILTGQGGDEWLTVSSMLMADLLRQRDLKSVYQLWQTARRSLRRPELALFRFMFWTCGLGPLVIPPTHKFAKRFAPSLVKMRRRVMAPLPKWLAPDPALRRQLHSRWEEKSLQGKPISNSFYLHEVKTSLDHPVPSWEMEELFNFGQMAGVRVVHPIWDPDLVDLLFRTPPFLLIRNGRSKGLVRESLARRFPNLGFEYKRKTGGTDFYASCIHREAKDVWKQLSGSRALGDLGVVDGQSIGPAVERLLAKCEIGNVHLAWSVLNLESWARAHTS